MNYRYAQNLKKITCEDFIPLFDQQQKHLEWNSVQVKEINVMKFRSLLCNYFLRKIFFQCFVKYLNVQF